MLDKIKQLFSKKGEETDQDKVAKEHLATAALLIEVMVIDGDLDEQELQSISATLCRILDLSQDQVEELIALSREEVAEATSLYQFTREINANFDIEGKKELLTCMWRVAYADGQLDKHEEGIIRRVADLLHIRHNEYIRCKLDARG
ncbi:MAG: TerB family tellurite resistance protein [Porticoccaceae bacterium]|nr:TerB family tellurite resistance protein [Porticoccaceae bacterium]